MWKNQIQKRETTEDCCHCLGVKVEGIWLETKSGQIWKYSQKGYYMKFYEEFKETKQNYWSTNICNRFISS